MIKNIVKYPTPLSVEYATDVRLFNDELFALIEDLKDTINENNLDGLAAYQIGNYYNVVVVKDGEEFIEIINPRLIGHSGSVETQESTAYYPGRSALVKRFETISIVYQDRNGEDKTLKASGDLAILLQRKIDYTFGATFIQKMSKKDRERFENGLDVQGGDYCPRTFVRDKIILAANVVTVLLLLLLIVGFFMTDNSSIFMIQLYGAGSVVLLDIFYFFYAQYEGKKYVGCGSCQIGNIIGTVAISLLKLSVVMGISYYFFGNI